MAKNIPLVVIDIVGLTPSMLGSYTPNLNDLVNDGFCCPLEPVFPAVTSTAQASMLTGSEPGQHGIVGNGWYSKELAEVGFWKQSNHLVQGEKVFDKLKRLDPDFKISKLFWWNNMYANVDHSMTPRPHYPADGRKVMDLYSTPTGLHEDIEAKIGKFPFFNFWGPKSDIRSSQWIVDAAKLEFDWNKPDLQLVYLPHLDYNLQRLGRSNLAIWQDVAAIDKVAGELIEHVKAQGAEVLVVSEYGITDVDMPVAINRVLREQGYLCVRQSLDWELLDAGASRAFAVVDHQVAHIYLKNSADVTQVKNLVEKIPGVDRVLDEAGKDAYNINHRRAGDLIAIADSNAWFSYYYWLDDRKAPDFARSVDIHRKPGYDPVELFVDPKIPLVPLKIAFRVLQKLLGFRMLMDVIPLDPSLVHGSHGRIDTTVEEGPLLIGPSQLAAKSYAMTEVQDIILRHFN